MVRKKSGSRRQSLKDKYKIEKKCKEHKRKLRKQNRQLSTNGVRKKTKVDPGVPNLWPFKDKIIAKMAQQRDDAVTEKSKLKNQRNGMMKRLMRAQEQVEDVEEKDELEEQAEENYAKRRWYFKEMKKVIAMSDVILEVVDARDPLGCRCKEIEMKVQQMSAEGGNKRIIIVLNKIDLVPPEVVTKWVRHLRREFPCVAFKASTQQQGSRLSQAPVKLAKATEGILNSGKCLGASTLMQLLKNYCRNRDVKTAINVGIIGYPNVGKSSIINSLKRSRVAGVGATPGFTTSINTIRLDKYVNMIDSPGVLFSPNCTQSELVLRNCIKLEQCEDPVMAVHTIASKCPQEQLMQLYKISEYNNADEFISHVAHKRGKIKKGGVPNLIAAARTVLKDWTTGAIPYYTLPPAHATSEHEAKSIISSWNKEFDLDTVSKEQDEELGQLSQVGTGANLFMQMESSAPLTMDAEDEEEDEEDGDEMKDVGSDEEEEGAKGIQLAMKPAKTKGGSKSQAHPINEEEQVGRAMKKQQKNQKKQKRREERAATGDDGDEGMKGADDEDAGMAAVEGEAEDRPYNFALDFV